MVERDWMITFGGASPAPPVPDDGRLEAAVHALVQSRTGFADVEKQIRILFQRGATIDDLAVRGRLPVETVRRVLDGENLELLMRAHLEPPAS